MTVEELINKLKEFPPELEVICAKAYEDGYYKVAEVGLIHNYVNIQEEPGDWNKVRFIASKT